MYLRFVFLLIWGISELLYGLEEMFGVVIVIYTYTCTIGSCGLGRDHRWDTRGIIRSLKPNTYL